MLEDKSKKRASIQSSNTFFNDDFDTISYRDSKFDKIKSIIKTLGVTLLIIGVIIGGYLYLDQTIHTTKDTIGNEAQQLGTGELIETDNAKRDYDATDTPAANTPNNSSTSQSSDKSSAANNGISSSDSDQYDPSKCDSYEATYNGLKRSEEQTLASLNNAINNQRTYGDIYEEVRKEYGDSSSMYQVVKIKADGIYNAQQDSISQLQTEWKKSLDKANSAYGDFLECRASL